MKIKKKIMIIIASVFLILGTIFPKQNDEKVEAFAVTGTALAIGTVATLIVGGTLLNQAVTENYGQDIIDYLGDKVTDISEFINYDSRTRLFNIVTSVAVLNAIHNVTTETVNDINDDMVSSSVRSTYLSEPELMVGGGRYYTDDIYRTIGIINFDNYQRVRQILNTQEYKVTFTVTGINTEQRVRVRFRYLDETLGTRGFRVDHLGDIYRNGTYTTTVTPNSYYETSIGSTARVLPDDFTGFNFVVEHDTTDRIRLTDIRIQQTVGAITDTDLYRQFENILDNEQAIEDRIASIPIDSSMTIALPSDVTTVSTFDEVIIGSADDIIADDDIPTDDDSGSGIFAVISNIWNFLKSLPGLLAKAFTGLFEYIAENIQSVTSAISSMFGSLMSFLSSMYNSLYDISSSITRPLWDIIGNLYDHVFSITSAIDAGITTVSDWLSEILESLINGAGAVISFPIDLFNSILDTIIDAYNAFDTWSRTFANSIADAVVGIVVPSDTMLDKIKTTFNELRAEFLLRFEFITVPIKSISTVFSSPKSLYDLNIEILNEKVHIMPRSFQSAINYARPIFSGVIVLITIIGIYKKVTVKEVV